MSSYTRTQRRTISDILVDEGLVSKEDVEEALRIQAKTRETLSSILVDMDCLAAADVSRTICEQYQLPFMRLANYDVNTKLASKFPAEFLHLNKILPFDTIGNMLLCVVTEIPTEKILAEIPRITRHNAALYVGNLSEVDQYLTQICPLPEGTVIGSGRPATRKPPAKKGDAQEALTTVGKIFNHESPKDLLEALDSTWDSIFDISTQPAEDVEDNEESEPPSPISP